MYSACVTGYRESHTSFRLLDEMCNGRAVKSGEERRERSGEISRLSREPVDEWEGKWACLESVYRNRWSCRDCIIGVMCSPSMLLLRNARTLAWCLDNINQTT